MINSHPPLGNRFAGAFTELDDGNLLTPETPKKCDRSSVKIFPTKPIHSWLVVWNMNFIFAIILGMSSSQLTNSIIFQRGWRTNHGPILHSPRTWWTWWTCLSFPTGNPRGNPPAKSKQSKWSYHMLPQHLPVGALPDVHLGVLGVFVWAS